jgi:type VI secretion system secreted protein VgrG
VLVDFLGADPDRPMVVGRVYTATTPPPYQLPKYKMVGGFRSESYPRAQGAPGQGHLGGGPIEAASAADAVPWLGPPPRHPVGGGVPLGQLGAPPAPSYADVTHNEIIYDDTVGAERLELHAARDYYRIVQHDAFVTVKHDDFLTVGHNKTDVIKRAYSMTAGSVSIGTGSYLLNSGSTKMYSKKKTLIAAMEGIMATSPAYVILYAGHGNDTHIELVPGEITINTVGDQIRVGPEGTRVASSSHVVLYAGHGNDTCIQLYPGSILLRAGGSWIEIDADGITLKGRMIDLNP